MIIKKICAGVFFAISCLVFASSLPANASEGKKIAVPQINKIDFIGSSVFLSGDNSENTEVLIYLNGTFIGLADQDINYQNFFYSFQPEITVGSIEIMAIARDKTSLVLSAPGIYNYILPEKLFEKLPPAPTIISPNIETISANPKELIIGLSQRSTRVHIYIDGIYNGKTDFLDDESITANFAYKPFLNLWPGEHYVQTMAENLNGEKSKISEKFFLKIEHPMPAPTLLDAEQKENKIIISGLAKNDSKINIFLNKQLSKTIEIKNHPSGTANFNVTLDYPADNVLIFATAEDSRSKESQWSNFLNINIEARQPRISPMAVMEINEEPLKEDPLVLSAEKEFKNEESQINNGYEKNEIFDKKDSFLGKIIKNLNYLIFLSFLISVLVFVYFIKKGLKKEEK